MTERVKVRRCPRCGRDDTLKIVYRYGPKAIGERNLLGVDAHCDVCEFRRRLEGYASLSNAS